LAISLNTVGIDVIAKQMENENENVNAPNGKKGKFKDLTFEMKWAIIAEYNFGRSGAGGIAKNGWRAQVVAKYGVSATTINKLVKLYDDQLPLTIVPDLSYKRLGICGKSNLLLTEEIADCIFELSNQLGGDFTYRDFTSKFNIEYEVEPPLCHTTMWNWFQELDAIQAFSYIKPTLKEEHLLKRLNFVLMKTEALNPEHRKFKNQNNHIHIDEKWFYVQRTRRKLKILPGQSFKAQDTRHKSHIRKVMFIAVIGKPHMVDGVFWDGKIGMFPVIAMGVAKKNSANRPAGTPVIENLTLSAEVYLDMMVRAGGILDRVKEKMPWAKNDTIVIQHDGAPGHNGKGNKVFLADAGQQGGWNIIFDTQPAHPPT